MDNMYNNMYFVLNFNNDVLFSNDKKAIQKNIVRLSDALDELQWDYLDLPLIELGQDAFNEDRDGAINSKDYIYSTFDSQLDEIQDGYKIGNNEDMKRLSNNINDVKSDLRDDLEE